MRSESKGNPNRLASEKTTPKEKGLASLTPGEIDQLAGVIADE